MRTPRDPIYAGHRYPAEIISYAVWLYFRFPLSLRMVEAMAEVRSVADTLGERTGMRRSARGPPLSRRLSAWVRQVDWAVKVEIDSFVLGRGRQRVEAEGRNVVTK